MSQAGILAPVPAACRYLTFHISPGGDVKAALNALANEVLDEQLVVGLGPQAVTAMRANVPGLSEPPPLSGAEASSPSSPKALWCWLRGADRGALLHRGRDLIEILAPGFVLDEAIDGFRYGEGRDLTGYVDGTENPEGDAAERAAFVRGAGEGLDGSSFAVVQRWVHDLDRFEGFDATTRDHVIGRRIKDNTEIADAPKSAHVKRTAQEDFDPEAFVVRRSMPWSESQRSGLMFVAFGHSFDAFEAQLQRMLGLDDGVTDALFTFSRPVSTSYFWCPPIDGGRLDLSQLAA